MDAAAQGLDPPTSTLRAVLPGLFAILVGIGLARFAYSPLIPALVGAGWFSPSQAAYLGAANLGGYLAGALAAGPMTAGYPARAWLRGTMLLAAATFFACALPLGFWWFFGWRFVSGLCGGVLMVLAAPTLMPHVPVRSRGAAGGLIFGGVGLGIAASGTLVPLLLRAGLPEAWCGLGALALLLTILAWRRWPADARPAQTATLSGPAPSSTALNALLAGYGLNAVGLVVHMVFFVDFVARGLDQGLDIGARYWVLFGLAAMVGPFAAGRLADRIGFALAVRLAYAAQAFCVAILALSGHPAALVLSTLVVGAALPGITNLVLGRANELVGFDPVAHRRAWSLATVAFSVGQAGAAYGFSYLFAETGSYALLFAIAAPAIAAALLLDLLAGVTGSRGRP